MKDSLEIFTTFSGKLSARIRKENGTIHHLHSMVNPEIEKKYYTDIEFWGNTIIFAGFGLGYHFKERISQISQTTTIIIIEYYRELIDSFLSTIININHNHIVIISSQDWEEKCSDVRMLLENQSSRPVQILKHPASYYFYKSFYDKILSNISIIPSGKKIYNQKKSKPLILYGNFFLENEMPRAFTKLIKEEPVIFQYEKYKNSINYENQLQKVIQNNRPDFILSINMKGFDGNGILNQVAQHFSIPVIVWFVDDPHPILLHQQQFISSNILAACWEKSYIKFLKKCGFGSVAYIPLGGDPEIFYSQTSNTQTVRTGFVGSSMGKNFLKEIQDKFLWSENLVNLVDYISEQLINTPDTNILRNIEAIARAMSITLPFSDKRNITWLCSYCIHIASMKKRRKIILSLLPYGIETFGDPEGWKETAGATIITHPDIDYNTQLCSIYNSINININITSCQMYSAVNQRIFDVPLCGKFIISDYKKDIEELFIPEKEVIYYKNIEELKELITYYESHPESMKNIIKAAYKRIIDEHTYLHRAEKIIDLL